MTGTWQAFAGRHVIIIAAPNGARRTRVDHPALPVTAAELAGNAAALRDAGVSVLHLHVRDEAGRHTLDPDRYREAMAAIRAAVGDDLILQVTTEAVGMYEPEAQMAVVRDLRPEAVSLAVREVCPAGADEAAFADFCSWMRAANVWPQFILYSAADVRRFEELRRRGVLGQDSPFVLFVLGRYAGQVDGRQDELTALLDVGAVAECPWAVCCFGASEHAVMLAATEAGGHVRIGFENNLQLADGSQAVDNAALIQAFTTAIQHDSRRPATAAHIRELLQI